MQTAAFEHVSRVYETSDHVYKALDDVTVKLEAGEFIVIPGPSGAGKSTLLNLLGVIVLYNFGVISYTEQYREMATLKVVGFQDRKIGSLLIGQNPWLSVLGVAVGIPAGIGTLGYLLHALAGEYEMKMTVSVQAILVSILLTVEISLLVSLMMARKNKKIDMVEALKGAE